MIRVLHIFGKMDRGGAEIRTVDLLPLLKKEGIHSDFCTLAGGNGQLDGKIRQLGRQVYPCPLKPELLTFGRRFVSLLKNSDYDIVHSHVHYFSGNIVRLAYKAGIKRRIVHFRNTSDGKKKSPSRRIYSKFMHHWVDRYATAIVAVSKGAMDFAWGSDWQKDQRACVIYNGVDLSSFDFKVPVRQSVLEEIGLPYDSKLIINVAHIHRQKAHDLLLDAAGRLISHDVRAHFIIVGEGELRDKMEKKASKLSIDQNVHFLGARDDVPRLLIASDCFVLPSRWEGLPGALLEALAANLPIVATDLPGVREIANHTDLIRIVPVEDKVALANETLKAYSSMNYHGKRNQSFPEEFSLERCAKKLLSVYTSQI